MDDMYQRREDLDIIFRRVSPEYLFDKMCEKYLIKLEVYKSNASIFDYKSYYKYSALNLHNISINEVQMRYHYMDQEIDKANNSLFCLLYEYAGEVLLFNDVNPTCRIEQLLNWNSIAHRLGQDIFTTSRLAYEDHRSRLKFESLYLDWAYCLNTNDCRLNEMLKLGTAENHFHLGGSTQSFSIAWASLMNHPRNISNAVVAEGNFENDLMLTLGNSIKDNYEKWSTRLKTAALIRALLFEQCVSFVGLGNYDDDLLSKFNICYYFKDWKKLECLVESHRAIYGRRIETTRESKCLDYAMCGYLYKFNPDSNNRILSGERAFLYHCFIRIFRDEFTDFEKDLFYLYLVIKSHFRGEMIQINKRKGFYNFALYQDRKRQFYRGMYEYEIEAQRLAINSSIEDNNIKMLEARIMPGNDKSEIAKEIHTLDLYTKLSNKKDLKKTFYVLHFAKRSMDISRVDSINGMAKQRNYKVRDKIRKQAKAICGFKKEYKKLQDRVRGIDACSHEIGCRPETFASEFRYLSDFRNYYIDARFEVNNEVKRLGVTYHVGEDFLDICDGLRAVDEAIEFLNLNNGDRIGHGLVLGLDPDMYYKDRRYSTYLTKQDYLDNCVWLIFRTLEWNIDIPTALREKLKNISVKLINDIYGSDNSRGMDCLIDYYHSWFLRGDNPELYITGKFVEPDFCLENNYWRSMKGDNKYDIFRFNYSVVNYYFKYHYDLETRKEGNKVIQFNAKPYIQVIKEIQTYLRKIIADKGISIECNPSSNYLIGYFNRYNHHPIFEFNDYILRDGTEKPQIKVTINTDDLGVFDTSLSNEYALIYCAIRRKRHILGLNNDEKIYDYLNRIRLNGLEISFGSRKNV